MSTFRAVLVLALAAFLAAVCDAAVAGPAPAVDPLEALSFLLGTWDAGANTGKLGAGTGGTTFERSLQGRVVVRTNHAEYPATGDRPVTKHDDLMVIYAAAGALEADYYDNEGHRIHYSISLPDTSHVVFLSEAPEGGPRFRLTYAKGDGKTVDGEFEMAAPGHPDAFQKYLAWQMRRTG
jgi:hypothetical protein